MMLREAAQQALAFIRWSQFGECRTDGWDGLPPKAHEVEAALRAALAEPVQEPVGWFESPHGAFRANHLHKIIFPSQLMAWQIPLYTAPPQHTPLTEEEIAALPVWKRYVPFTAATKDEIVRAVERAHGIVVSTPK